MTYPMEQALRSTDVAGYWGCPRCGTPGTCADHPDHRPVWRDEGPPTEEQHRELVAITEKRGQQVWIPVTVAALLPGTALAIPFASALRQLFGT